MHLHIWTIVQIEYEVGEKLFHQSSLRNLMTNNLHAGECMHTGRVSKESMNGASSGSRRCSCKQTGMSRGEKQNVLICAKVSRLVTSQNRDEGIKAVREQAPRADMHPSIHRSLH
jgi:hypothetical protein